MVKHLTEEEIAICADALNTGGYRNLSAHIREHLAQCDDCAGEVLLVADIAGEVDFKAESETPVREKAQRIIAWSVSIAAAVALILLVIDQEINPFENKQLITKNSTTEQIIKNSDTGAEDQPSIGDPEKTESHKIPQKPETTSNNTPKDSESPASSAPSAPAPAIENIPDTLKFLANYTPDKNMEKLIARFEGNLRDNSDIVVKTPVSITLSQSSVIIRWTNPERKRLIIEVFDNNGKQILETETDEEEYTIENLNKGLYYWKLISGSDFDLLFCGKITVK